MSNKKHIAIFGGSFNPVHTDHISIAKACHNDLDFDEVWMVPSWLNPFKEENYGASVKDRLNMLNIAIKPYNFIKINEYEIHKKNTSYTYETLCYLLENFPDFEFEFIMGSDQLDNFEKWNHFNELIKLIKFNVFERSNDINYAIVDKYNLKLFKFDNKYISSTDLRNLKNLWLQIPEVNDYINYNLLYVHERIENHMDYERFLHSLNVGQLAKQLALIHGVNPEEALIAGTLHDIAKRWDENKSQEYLKKYLPALLDEPKPTWHSYVGYLHLQKDWLISNQNILLAVFKHTVGSPEMTPLDMIVFIADKISYERNYDGVEELRQLAKKDLLATFKKLLKNQYERAIAKHGINSVGNLITQTYDFWIGEA